MTAAFLIRHLQLTRHPEGGYYRETYRASGIIPGNALPDGFTGDRRFSTCIYYLLENGDRSVFHRLRSDECWHFYGGQALLIHVIDAAGRYSCIRLGNDLMNGENLQFVVPASTWFASEPASGSTFSLAGCTVAPGFDFADFEIASQKDLLGKFPAHTGVVQRLCR